MKVVLLVSYCARSCVKSVVVVFCHLKTRVWRGRLADIESYTLLLCVRNQMNARGVTSRIILFSRSVIRPTCATRTCDIVSLVYCATPLRGKQIFTKISSRKEQYDQYIDGHMISILTGI